MQEAVTPLRREWNGGDVVGGDKARPPVSCKALMRHGIQKVNEAFSRDDILSDSVEHGHKNIPPSYNLSQDSRLEALETGDKVELLAFDVEKEEGGLEEDPSSKEDSLEATLHALERCDEDANDMETSLAT